MAPLSPTRVLVGIVLLSSPPGNGPGWAFFVRGFKSSDLSHSTAEMATTTRYIGFCPGCGTNAVHEDNGCVGSELTWCCVECGCCFDEVPV